MCQVFITTNFCCESTVVPPFGGSPPRFVVPKSSRLHAGDSPGRSDSMWNSSYQMHDGPPINRLWEDEDIAAYVGFQSIEELMARHPDFPKTVPLGMQGRRWRPSDIIDWIHRLCAEDVGTIVEPTSTSKTPRSTRKSSQSTEIPAFDMSLIAEQLKELNHG